MLLCLHTHLDYFDPGSSVTTTPISCCDQRYSWNVQSFDSDCSIKNNLCAYMFQYEYRSGISGFTSQISSQLLIHRLNLLLNSINHDLDFNASFSYARRSICDYKKSTLIQSTVYKYLIKEGSVYSISDFDATQSNLKTILYRFDSIVRLRRRSASHQILGGSPSPFDHLSTRYMIVHYQISKFGVSPKEFIDKDVYMDLDDVEVKLGELEAELSVIKVIVKTLEWLSTVASLVSYMATLPKDVMKAILESYSRVLQGLALYLCCLQ
ncbi:hypothetical protein Bca4012_027463 [Brassica carinata]